MTSVSRKTQGLMKLVGSELMPDSCPSQKIVAYPVSKGAIINVVSLVHDDTREETRHEGPWFENVSNAEVLSVFQGFEPEVQALLEVCRRLR